MAKKEEKVLFPAQEESEIVLDILRKHWFTYVIFWFVVILMLTPLFVGFVLWSNGIITLSETWQNVLILFITIYLLFILGLLMYGFVDFYLDVYIVTDRRIVDISQDGLFRRSISELSLAQIQDVNATVCGFAPTIFHYGDVRIQTAGDVPIFVFHDIPHPYEISKKIIDLHESYMQQQENKEKQIVIEKNNKGNNSQSKKPTSESINKTLTEKWFEEGAEFCYSDESSRQRILAGVNKHLNEEKNKLKINSTNKKGELKEGKEVDL